MAVLCANFEELPSKPNNSEETETSSVVSFSLPPKKRKLEHFTIDNADFPRKRREQMGLLPKLLSLGVNQPTWILRKTLAKTDLCKCESRLLLTSKIVAPSPLLDIFTESERESVRDRMGLKLRVFDWIGKEYKMVFKFLQSNSAYRLIGEWSRFLRDHDGEMRICDSINIWAFRVEKREGGNEICMALSLCKQDEELMDERDDCKEEEGSVESCLNERKETKNVTADEWIAAAALLELKGIFGHE